jgi:tetratricopeptide (TPR) repeat protein
MLGVKAAALALAGLCLAFKPAHACLWFNGTDLQGRPVTVEGFSAQVFVDQLQHPGRSWEADRERFEHDPTLQSDTKVRSDYGAVLVHLGRLQEALKIFQEIERRGAGDYVTAANLGTTYELTGDNQDALIWIKQAVVRNPDSHYGTEWLHVNILEAKLALTRDPRWLESHSVLGIYFGSSEEPVKQDREQMRRVQRALVYQLQERLEFVKPPDPIIADLLFDLGNVMAVSHTLEHGLPLYDLSLKFGSLRYDIIAKRKAHFESAIFWGGVRRLSRTILYWAGALAFVGFLIWRVWNRRRRAAPS